MDTVGIEFGLGSQGNDGNDVDVAEVFVKGGSIVSFVKDTDGDFDGSRYVGW